MSEESSVMARRMSLWMPETSVLFVDRGSRHNDEIIVPLPLP